MRVRNTARFGDRPDARSETEGQYPAGAIRVVYDTTTMDEHPCADAKTLIEAMIERENMTRALHRVESNTGAAGIDKMPAHALRAHLGRHWERIRTALLAGRYEPSPVRLVEIPKPDGRGMRQLGIPTVVDRLIAQALTQILTPRVARKITDKRVLKLLRRFLQAGIMTEGIAMQRTEGTPQGSPLSPLLSNILLDMPLCSCYSGIAIMKSVICILLQLGKRYR